MYVVNLASESVAILFVSNDMHAEKGKCLVGKKSFDLLAIHRSIEKRVVSRCKRARSEGVQRVMRLLVLSTQAGNKTRGGRGVRVSDEESTCTLPCG